MMAFENQMYMEELVCNNLVYVHFYFYKLCEAFEVWYMILLKHWKSKIEVKGHGTVKTY